MRTPNNVIFTQDIEGALNDFLKAHQYSKTAVLVDENTMQHCYPKIESSVAGAKIIKISSGEEEKNLQTCTYIWKELTNAAFDRKSLLINLGGGVIGDMGGFCAATYKRGIDFINIPTTLLAQVDASIGGKSGIDFDHFKNQIGVFQVPKNVFISTTFLNTLDPRELRSGFAEIIKHNLIADARSFDDILIKNFYQLDLEPIIRQSVAIKSKIVEKDPNEKGYRKVLNFGHTIGHAIESYFLSKQGHKLLHGEAIAVGMICEVFLSTKKAGLSCDALSKISNYLFDLYKPEKIEENDINAIARLTLQDKKNEKNMIMCSLLKAIGDCVYNVEITEYEVRESIKYFNHQLEMAI